MPERRGIESYFTQDGLRVMMLHYSADPLKDPDTKEGATWLRKMLKGFPGGMEGAKWRQEMELDFAIRAGDRVFPDWDAKLEPRITYEPGDVDIPDFWPIYCGLDWGVVNKTVWTAHTMESAERCYLFDEVVMLGPAINEFLEVIQRKPYYDRVRGVIGDPSMWIKNQQRETSVTSIGDMLSDIGNLYVQKGRNEPGVDMAFIALLKGYLWADLDNPRWMISRDCTSTIRCFRNLRKKPNLKMRDYTDAPEEIINKNVDEFDSCKYPLLSLGFDAPDIVEVMPQSFDWWLDKVIKEKARYRNVF